MTATAEAPEEAAPVLAMWQRKDQFTRVLPKSVDVDAFLGTAAAALYADEKKPGQKTPTLMEAAAAHPLSLVTTLMRCAALGHMPGTDEYYLHVRKGKITGTEGYRGVVERMYRSGAVRKVIVREVCAKDRFRFIEGADDRPYHITGGGSDGDDGTGAGFFGANGSRDRGPMVGAYAYAELADGAISRVVLLDRDDVMAARAASEAADSDYSPWNRLDAGPDHPELRGRSMWWKTAAKRLEPWVPTSAEYRRQMMAAAATGALPAPAVAALTAAPARELPAGSGARYDAAWLDQAIGQAENLRSEHAAGQLWRETAAKAGAGAITPADAAALQDLIGTRVTAIRQNTYDQAMSLLSENEPWRDKIDELATAEDADRAVAELDEADLDRRRDQRVRRAITALARLKEWHNGDEGDQ